MGPGLLAQVPKKSIYHDTWIDLNKNGGWTSTKTRKRQSIDASKISCPKMNLDEKTCQTATLYGRWARPDRRAAASQGRITNT